MRRNRITFMAAFLSLAVVSGASAQGVTISVHGGAYQQASDFATVRAGIQEMDFDYGTTFSFGGNLEFGSLRLTTAYVSGATIERHGVAGKVGEGSLLAASADLLGRPFPRVLGLQPYILGGIGFKRHNYNLSDTGLPTDFKELKDNSEFAFHWGIGADVMFGRLGFMAEISDFVAFSENSFGAHDAFAVVGLKLRLF